jgi:hypothetical protein
MLKEKICYKTTKGRDPILLDPGPAGPGVSSFFEDDPPGPTYIKSPEGG